MKKNYLLLLLMALSLQTLCAFSAINEADALNSLSSKDTALLEAHPHKLFVRIPDIIRNAFALTPQYYPSDAYSNDFLNIIDALHEGYTVVPEDCALRGVTNALEIIKQQKKNLFVS